MPVSDTTLVRLLQASRPPTPATPKVLGVDDWSLKKGQTYGTILVDMEKHKPIDLLPDREAETLTRWLLDHPGIEIICRDRASGYAEGATNGAPQAVQIADRWHLLKNLGEALQRMLDHKSAQVRATAQQLAHQRQAKKYEWTPRGSSLRIGKLLVLIFCFLRLQPEGRKFSMKSNSYWPKVTPVARLPNG
ncbi:MAG: transposase [Cyclobacteriaceae bacterium]